MHICENNMRKLFKIGIHRLLESMGQSFPFRNLIEEHAIK